MRLAVMLLVVACGRQPAPPPSAAPAAVPHAAEPECEISECGPPMRMPNRVCPDGSMAGPSGRCLRKSDGRCAWEVRNCP